MKIARCTPSRGLVHSRTEEAADLAREWAEVHGHTWGNFWTHDLPIPDCFNESVGQAYRWGADLVWILEEDVRPVPVAFPDMAGALTRGGADVAIVDYTVGSPAHGFGRGIARDGVDRIGWGPTGCILIKRVCFDRLPRPWFTVHTRLLSLDGTITWQSDTPTVYGVDVEFTHALGQLGFNLQEVEAKCDHLRVVERGPSENNDGRHRIEPLPVTQRRPIVPPSRRSHHGSS